MFLSLELIRTSFIGRFLVSSYQHSDMSAAEKKKANIFFVMRRFPILQPSVLENALL